MTSSREAPSVEGDRGGGPLRLRRAGPALQLTNFVAGAVVLTVEVLGTRILGPVFGVSLFVWAALLTVTLGSLAIGYFVAGRLIDRSPTFRVLGGALLGASACLFLEPIVAHPVLASVQSLGLRAGPIVSAVLLFAPSLACLGGVGPISIRLSTAEVEGSGGRAGTLYAVSTLGSLVGTLVTAFILVPVFETQHVVLASGVAIGGCGVLAISMDRGRLVVASLIPFVGLVIPTIDGALPEGFRVLARARSLYGAVEVIEDETRSARLLRSDHSVIGAQSTIDHSSSFAFTHLMEAVRFARPHARSLLQIGLGIGSLPMAVARDFETIDVVELDPAVARFAREYFGFSNRGSLIEEDARTVLRTTRRTYDVIVHDTFTGGTTPEHLLSREVVERIHQLLDPGGVLVMNFIGSIGGEGAEATNAVYATLQERFADVLAFRDEPPTDPASVGNIIFFASDSAIEFEIPPDAHFENRLCASVQRAFTRWNVTDKLARGTVITDERNPLARLELGAAEEHFRAMNELLPPEVWLH